VETQEQIEKKISLSEALQRYRTSEAEKQREASLTSLFGAGESVLDVGAKEGHYSRMLKQRYRRVVALDLKKPDIPDVECVAGDACKFQFRDGEFDTVLAAEVLEHIPEVERAAREIARVAARRVVIGVPYKQDIRLGRATCPGCGAILPPWGHLHSFEEARLKQLFAGMKVETFEYIGTSAGSTTALATWLMDRAGNPWGNAYTGVACACGSFYSRPSTLTVPQRIAAKLATTMNSVQASFTRPHANWIHAVFIKG
jgi:SAM-dependent methyltransferase